MEGVSFISGEIYIVLNKTLIEIPLKPCEYNNR